MVTPSTAARRSSVGNLVEALLREPGDKVGDRGAIRALVCENKARRRAEPQADGEVAARKYNVI